MILIELLKHHSEYGGIDAPTFTWWAACVLLVLPLCALAYLWWLVIRDSRTLESTVTSIDQLRTVGDDGHPTTSEAGRSRVGLAA